MEEGLYDYLLAQAGITNLIGTRLYQNVAPQSPTFPYIVQYTSGVEQGHHHGAAENTVTTSIVLEMYGEDYSDLKDLAIAVRAELDGFGRAAMGSTNVIHCRKVQETDFFDRPMDGGEKPIHIVTQEYDFGHYITVPTF